MSINLWGAEVTVRVSSAAPDAEPVWVDISEYVIVPRGTTIDTWLGKATELPSAEPAKGKLTLLNNDDRFTPGNPTSPYFPWWKQSRRFQIVETVFGKDFVLGDLYLEIPQNTAQIQPTDGDVKQITLSVTGVDVLARLKNGRKFLSALAEHIVFHGGSDLKGYWPLTAAAQPFTSYGPPTTALVATSDATGTLAPTEKVQPQAGEAPPGSEGAGIRCSTFNPGPGRAYVVVNPVDDSGFAMADSDALVYVFWHSTPALNTALSQQLLTVGINGASSTISLLLDTQVVAADTWGLTATNAMTGTIGGPTVVTDALLPWGVYIRPSTSQMELWIGSVRLTTTLTGTPPTGMTAHVPQIGYQIDFDMSNFQIYIGTNFGYTQYLQQIAAGHAPLDRQLTGERVNTILDYARFPASRRSIDPGVAVMSQATLAGKTPGQALEEALTVERGRLFAQAGDVHFRDRTSVYNV